MPPADAATAVFQAHRPRLVRLAYRMLGSIGEAEDVVQDAWLRWRRVDLDKVAAPPAFLSRIVTRLCLDVMKSARARRETYVGPWLPEPLVAGLSLPDPEPDADDLTLTLMLALERLSPLERAAFLLHDVFGVPLGEVAATLEREPPAVRQLAARARQHVRDGRPRFPVARDEGARIAQAFFAASRSGDVGALHALLADDIVLRSDGGGRVHAFRNPILGVEKVARLYARLAAKESHAGEMLRPLVIDGLPGFLSRERGGLLQTTAFAIAEGRITDIYITRNPDKLARLLAALALDAPAAGQA
ncbi:sigma-70 family RNA polymerase sigma factor [Azorhizobium doebereinerae]|uniref:sigma-70 family RNA polymerase sigma factor n=1 Tax=Azorhizobium doebereinerae TaxID=281091 RepID=UPI00041C5F67|nr:sigma-70 family RNA polymerase sigma factor [Azorhizobium doebereinerae]